MPLPKKAANKPATRRLSDLNLPTSGAPLIVGDAPRTKVEEWFDKPFNKKLDDEDAENFSSPFDILNAEKSTIKDRTTGAIKDTICFLVRSHEDEENYYFFMGANAERTALCEAFESDDTPVVNVCFHRFDTGQPQPFVKIIEHEGGTDETPF